MLLFFLFFFTHLSNMVTEHQTTDYRITYTQFFPKRRTDTAAARGQEGVSRLCLQGPPLSCPGLIKFCFCFFFLLFFGKSKFVKPQNQMRIPLKNELFSIGTHAPTSTTWPSRTDLQTELASDIQTPPPKKKPNQTWAETSLASFCLVLNMNTYFDMFAQGCVGVQKLSACV